MPVIATTSGGIGLGRLVEGGEDVADADDAAVRQVVELDHAELDDLVLGVIEAGRFGIEQDAGPDLLPEVAGCTPVAATRRRSTR